MSEYQDCMTEAMRKFPKGISKEERGSLFCVQAKLCSGKAKDQVEAEKLCLESSGSPKPTTGKKQRRAKFNPGKIAQCLLPKLIDVKVLSVEELTSLIDECSVSATKATTYKRFMNACVKEQGVAKDLPQNLRFIRACEAKWREQRDAQS